MTIKLVARVLMSAAMLSSQPLITDSCDRMAGRANIGGFSILIGKSRCGVVDHYIKCQTDTIFAGGHSGLF
ncbi:hypothetical protein FEF65_05165 [Mariprofundus erugo]|uniref:Uncharacterized protein n=1 Tax=Mariprofundus erugo TaxID=2528639 RepID=A0A5R9GPB4_9PROT|nr:hypothetical protein [Mariprofundus erugo]TLS67840.1 hypothetical protein FEF65_05165 [Mariprofundus erugo]